ncbi:MAG TPA: DUF4010 domain-containing protein, partial [Candidatus Thermoplasmatota archaeon]|nr:DUF4010 domain-containing protein [Candidatus Thermoplasmatota archaeon]
ATTTMLARNLAIVAFADPSLQMARALWPYLLPVALVGGAAALWLGRGQRGEPIPAVRVRNPFAVLPALRFALLFAGVSILATAARAQFGEAGVYVAAVGGFVSAGAVLGSVAGLYATGAIPFAVAVKTAVLATAASVAVKLVIVRAFNPDMLRPALVPFLAMAAAALLSVAGAFLVAAVV